MHSRTKKLIRPGLQLRLIRAFLGAAVVAVLLHGWLLNSAVGRLEASLPNDAALVAEQWPRIFFLYLVSSLAVLVPLLIGIGVLASSRIAGPLYRFETFLRAVERGEQSEACQLRDGDELKELCEILNRVTAPLRDATPSNAAAGEATGGEGPEPRSLIDARSEVERSA